MYEVAPAGIGTQKTERLPAGKDVVIPSADHLAGAAEPLYPDRDTPGWHLPDIAHVAADRPPSLDHGAITP